MTTNNPPPPEPHDKDYPKYIPDKYIDFKESVFNPLEFEKLPEHHPFDIDIELEDGISPPF
ncbi:hypothetical protein PQX77_014515, partial [Marasmius sp. AFHP31]